MIFMHLTVNNNFNGGYNNAYNGRAVQVLGKNATLDDSGGSLKVFLEPYKEENRAKIEKVRMSQPVIKYRLLLIQGTTLKKLPDTFRILWTASGHAEKHDATRTLHFRKH